MARGKREFSTDVVQALMQALMSAETTAEARSDAVIHMVAALLLRGGHEPLVGEVTEAVHHLRDREKRGEGAGVEGAGRGGKMILSL